MPKRYASVSSLRAHLADALDHAERGEVVEVERRGRVFVLSAVKKPAPDPAKPWFEVTDPELLEHGWTWAYEDGELTLQTPRSPARGRRR